MLGRLRPARHEGVVRGLLVLGDLVSGDERYAGHGASFRDLTSPGDYGMPGTQLQGQAWELWSRLDVATVRLDSRSAGWGADAAMSDWKVRIKDEVRELLPPTIFFLIAFHIIVLSRALMLEEFRRQVSASPARRWALLVAKVVLLADLLPFIKSVSGEAAHLQRRVEDGDLLACRLGGALPRSISSPSGGGREASRPPTIAC